jgi:uncharacterized membrane protein
MTSTPVTLKGLLEHGISSGNRLMGLGVLFLGLTPVLRVAMLIYLWCRERDWKFAAVALVVFITLLISISLGGG